jgi:hypothetical protein
MRGKIKITIKIKHQKLKSLLSPKSLISILDSLSSNDTWMQNRIVRWFADERSFGFSVVVVILVRVFVSYSYSSSSSFSLLSPMYGYGLLRSFLLRNPNWRIELVAHWICTRVNSSLAFYYIYMFPLFLQLGEISVYTTTTELKMSQQLRFLSPRTFSRLHHHFAFISLRAFPVSLSHARTEVRFQSKFQSNNVVAASSDNVDPQKLQVRTTIPAFKPLSFDWGFWGTASILFLAVMWWEGGSWIDFSFWDFSRCVRSKFWKNVLYCVCSLLSKCL